MLTVRSLALAALTALVLSTSVVLGQTTAPIRVGVQLDDGSAAILWAKNAGLFERAGLNVDIQKFPSGTAAAAAIAGGSLEIARSNPVTLVTAHSKGVPFAVIAPVTIYKSEAPDLAMIVPIKSTLGAARDFNGKTFAVSSLGDFYTLAVRAWLEKNGGNVDSVHFVELPPPAIPAALDQGRIDAAPLANPILDYALSTGKYRIAAKVFDAVSPRFVQSLFFARTDWIAGHRDVVEKFAGVIRDANVYVTAHQSETIPLIAAFMSIDPATIAKMPRPDRPPYVDASEIQPIIDLLARYKVIERAFPAQEMISPSALKSR